MLAVYKIALLVAPIAVTAIAAGHSPGLPAACLTCPDLVELGPGAFDYRASGEFTRDGKPMTAPIVTVSFSRPLAMMKHQVTAADYRRCVEAQACPAGQDTAAANYPMIDVSWRDAQSYASWLSRETGLHFRLPTDEEWAYAAASRFQDDALPASVDDKDPGQRALAIYDREASRQALDKASRPIGSFGANENGLLDMAGNVWEWTDTCYVRSTVDARADVAATVVSCGVRVVEGRHRTYLSDFIRDARAGGCSVSSPPSNLGFRLVRDDGPWLRSLSRRIQQLVGLDG